MPPLTVAIRLLSPTATLPAYATAGAAGLDLSAALLEPMLIEPGRVALVPCGFAIALPGGFEAQVRPRSGLAVKHGVTVLNSPFRVEPGMRIAQMIVAPVSAVTWSQTDALPDTARADGGFGHTGGLA